MKKSEHKEIVQGLEALIEKFSYADVSDCFDEIEDDDDDDEEDDDEDDDDTDPGDDGQPDDETPEG
jgi:hypothetical protein